MFSTWLQNTRHKLNLTQQQLANALAVTPSTVGMWEQGRRLPSARAAARLRAFFTAQGCAPAGAPRGAGRGGTGPAASGDAGAGETGAENEMIAGRRVVDGTTVGKEPPFWRRLLDPDVMAMLWVSALLLTVGLRLLWKE